MRHHAVYLRLSTQNGERLHGSQGRGPWRTSDGSAEAGHGFLTGAVGDAERGDCQGDNPPPRWGPDVNLTTAK